MMRSLLFLTVLLTVSGCTFGLRGGDVYQARGVTLALEMRGAGVIAGELLTVESGAFVIDAVDEVLKGVLEHLLPPRIGEENTDLKDSFGRSSRSRAMTAR